MAIDKNRINARSDAGILIAVTILALALGIVVWMITDLPWYSVFLVFMIVIGAYILIRSIFMESTMDMAPTRGEFGLVWGYLLLAVGFVGVLAITTDLKAWILFVVLLILVALLIVFKSMKGRM
ncbi:MAG: hypothetical protein WDA05_02425 [Candidatus Methanomethylophilaceae archaeon]|jgi:hypothetical protein|nr:hypothetical protein AOA81_03665 [Methanomassiliicoccales archaeon RumEn M2]MDD2778709.1 hypothetical protein [Candidatus Methanomethylophilaceae archaeon]MDI9378546.1 hypothetical protein [Candidatus Thermoplasmatota archaeon]MDD3128100.1 hypothetical protein [Candidatus Methanomethylophilaceae archaeon]MDD4119015.1 hypothetical protein [Candidatus Methanomethylophilaceae archaeon]